MRSLLMKLSLYAAAVDLTAAAATPSNAFILRAGGRSRGATSYRANAANEASRLRRSCGTGNGAEVISPVTIVLSLYPRFVQET